MDWVSVWNLVFPIAIPLAVFGVVKKRNKKKDFNSMRAFGNIFVTYGLVLLLGAIFVPKFADFYAGYQGLANVKNLATFFVGVGILVLLIDMKNYKRS